MTIPGYDNPSVVKGRIVTLEFDNYYLVGTYVPNAGEKLKVHSSRFQKYIIHLYTGFGHQERMEHTFWQIHAGSR
jgi:exonuclease III